MATSTDKRIRAVLFDMDGVLIDAKEWHYEALNQALGLFGHKIRRAEHLETYDGLPTKTKLRLLSHERGLPLGLHELINDIKQSYTLDNAWTLCRPRFAHEQALSRLKAEGYQIAVCSNSVRGSIEMMLGKASLLPWVDLIVSNQDVSRPKPDPEMYLQACHKLGRRPDECLVVEDNPHGIEAARAAGCHLMVVATPDDVHWAALASRLCELERGSLEAAR